MHFRRCCFVILLALPAYPLSACSMQGPADEPAPRPAAVAAPVAVSTPVAVPAPHDVSETASDRVITERLRAVFGEDYEIAPTQPAVGIATARGVVTLTGRVETDRQRSVMAGHARATEGVTSVDNQILLAP